MKIQSSLITQKLFNNIEITLYVNIVFSKKVIRYASLTLVVTVLMAALYVLVFHKINQTHQEKEERFLKKLENDAHFRSPKY